jgi:hypothetical protein
MMVVRHKASKESSMQSVVTNETLPDALMKAKTLVEVRDTNGMVIGFFAPVALEHASRYAEAAAAMDPMAARRAAKEGPGKTTAEVLEYLQTLESR